MSDDSHYSDQEAKDANDNLPRAVRALEAKRYDDAEQVLKAVVANTPVDYCFQYESSDGTLCIKFWDQADFIHYVTRLQEKGKADRSIIWQGNAYGRAHYYLGFVYVKQQKPGEALPYLKAGLNLEPDSPLLRMEYAKAFGLSGSRIDALREYDKVVAQGNEITPSLQAMALRGKGFTLIELDRLDEAETAFNDSLKIDPRNQIAKEELKYIRHLRDGGEIFAIRSSEGQIEPARKWWQFWRS